MNATSRHCEAHCERTEAFDLVEECAVVMWNIARELMFDEQLGESHSCNAIVL